MLGIAEVEQGRGVFLPPFAIGGDRMPNRPHDFALVL
jgi:hypothetical protein